MYDANAQLVAIKAIGTVESNMNYSAVNYADPITIGFAQWYGTRAANILFRIQAENPASFAGVASSLVASMSAHPASDAWWNNRYLTRAEGSSLAPVLLANKAIQDDQATKDLDAYVRAAESAGIDKDANTLTMLLFFVAYHQSPKRALSVIGSVGPTSSIERYYAALLNEPVLGQYKNRYTTARDIILAGDIDISDNPPDVVIDDTDGRTDTFTRPKRDVRYIEAHVDVARIHFTDGQVLTAYPNGRGWFIPGSETSLGAVVPDDPVPPPVTPPPSDVAARRTALADFMRAQVGRFDYSQGATRLNPEQNMYTDCSGLCAWVYRTVLGIDIGTYTGNQYNKGMLVAQGRGNITLADAGAFAPGDLIFYNWPGRRETVDHVEMYLGGNEICGQRGGSHGKGPDISPVTWGAPDNWIVRRHVY